MPKRPRSHQLGDLARDRLKNLFNEQGWTVEDVQPDYGLDLLVRVFRDSEATEYLFFVQSKGTDHVERYLKKDGRRLSYSVKASHLRHWVRHWEPVLLIVWDARGDRFYWECVQTALEESDFPASRKQKSFSIAIPTTNGLDAEGIKRIVGRTKGRFKRFAREKEGAEQLVGYLRERLKLEISYDPQVGLLCVPHGRFVPAKSGRGTMIFFGRMAQDISEGASKLGMSEQEFVNILESKDLVKLGVETLEKMLEMIRTEGSVTLLDSDGRLRQFHSIAEYYKACVRDLELKEAN